MLALLTRGDCRGRLARSAATRDRNEAITINTRLLLESFFLNTVLPSFLVLTLQKRAMRRSVTDFTTVSALETEEVRADHVATRSVADEVCIGLGTPRIPAYTAERSLIECRSLTTMKA
jgi:hypothetical protein